MHCASFQIRVEITKNFAEENFYSIDHYTSSRKAYFLDSTTREQSNCRRQHKMENRLDRR